VTQRWPWISLLLAAVAVALPAGATADQSSQPSSPLAGTITAGDQHSCAVISAAAHCWGFNGDGQLGYGNTLTVGDNETPGVAGAIDFGAGRTVTAITAGSGHTCALLDDATAHCWGLGGNGRLGYGNTNSIGDDEPANSAGAINFGAGHTVKAISAGDSHTCAILDDGTVRCWGYAAAGQLGYGNTFDVSDPSTVGAVALGGVKATAITAGGSHTCALLEDATVRCWGYGPYGQLGNGDNVTAGPGQNADTINNIGDNELPTAKPPVSLGLGRTATAISAGNAHTCALLNGGDVRCWGYNGYGQLGYGNTSYIGDDETPGSVGPVALGGVATAITAGGQHSCAVLAGGDVRCWGGASFGQPGYGNQTIIGDDEDPDTVGPVQIGAPALAIDAGRLHTCVLLDTTGVRCWGYGAGGRLGYCSLHTIGDNEVPGSVGPVDLGTSGAGCPPAPGSGSSPPPSEDAPAGDEPPDPKSAEAARARQLRACLRRAKARPQAARKRARRACLKRYGRTPSRVRHLRLAFRSRTRIVLTFAASGSDRRREPPARSYVVKQSLHSIRRGRDFDRAPTLCAGFCRFTPARVGAKIKLTVTGLEPGTTYFFAVVARDNVSHRRGPRSPTVRVKTK
jgi:alpha-tubulin suppressor-like RCC1 family protein